ncbi:MAG: glycerol-3-phosphate 1-O-acyltransferase PlsY [Gemmatimonadales bacterium]|nr:glycerol-3-phosphate 1-O-acyltransferase PlsY [Gemmatimonadales bacterium]
MSLAVWLVASYLVGAIPTSYWVARVAKGIDLRTVGSGNLGATNVYRTLGWRYAIPVALVDIAKGVVPVLVFGPRASDGLWIPLLLGLAAVVGHVFSPFVGFKGGKGVATAAGVVLGIAPLATLVSLATWVAVVRLTGYVSLGSILAALVLPPATWLLDPAARPVVGLFAGLALFIVAMHRKNIERLRAGTENRFGSRPAASPEPPR